MEQFKCLFEHHEDQPPKLKKLLEKWEDKFIEGINYNELENLKKECEKIGYTFEYGLDAEPYNLMTISHYNNPKRTTDDNFKIEPF